MPHQDKDYLHKNLKTLKALFDRLLPEQLVVFRRHGNATLEPFWLAAVAITGWGWTAQTTLDERVQTACRVVGRLFGVKTTVTRQGLTKALAATGASLVELIVDQLATSLAQLRGGWTSGGKVNVAVDGTKMAAPRTEANQREFAANAVRKNKSYCKPTDQSKAATVQVLVTVFWHLGSGLPLRWKADGSGGSERQNVQQAVDQLPRHTRLIGDAEYVGYPLWSTIIRSGRSFLFRVGSNVTLLKNLGRLRFRDGYVYCWPDRARQKDQAPLVLRLFQIHNGKKTLYLVSNELQMSDDLACQLYRERWGVEVFFRSVKQSCQRQKLHCGVPQNVMTELNWTLLGLWTAMFAGKQALHGDGVSLDRLSPIKVLRAFQRIMQTISLDARHRDCLTQLLTAATIADESDRTTSKRSRHYPRKKKHRECGPPILETASAELRRAAKKFKL